MPSNGSADLNAGGMQDAGVAVDGVYVCQNFEEHPGQEIEMQSGPWDGYQCPRCGRGTGGDLEIPYQDPPDNGGAGN